MKKISLLCVLMIPFVVLGLLISCQNNGGGGFFISASLDGTTYDWTFGLTNVEDDAFGEYYTWFGPGTLILATPEPISSTSGEPSSYVWFDIDSSSTSPATYTIADFWIAFYRINNVNWYFTNITFEITKYGAVGDTIEGTFSGTISDGASTMTVTNGQFKVVRAADDAW